jgi:glucose/arabinose dehydrogenase
LSVTHPPLVIRALLVSIAATAVVLLTAPGSASAATYPIGFSEQTAFSGLTNPTAVRFAADGRVFVAEKSGLIKVFDSLSDSQPEVFADLRTQVHNFWDRGLLGLALDPGFPDAHRTCTCCTRTMRQSVAQRRAGAHLARRPTDALARRARPATAAWLAAGCRGSPPRAT